MNNDLKVTVPEAINNARVVAQPFNFNGVLAPYAEIQKELFDYIDTTVDPLDPTVDVHDKQITRSELKAVLPQLYPGEVLDDTLVTREMRQRIWNLVYEQDPKAENAVITGEDFSKYIFHYRMIRIFWNHQKGRIPATWETIQEQESQTLEEFISQDNMLLRRGFDSDDIIPRRDFEWTFHDYDEDKDGLVTWDELWYKVQRSDINYHQFRDYFFQFDANRDYVITNQEILDFYSNLTPQEQLTKAQEL